MKNKMGFCEQAWQMAAAVRVCPQERIHKALPFSRGGENGRARGHERKD